MRLFVLASILDSADGWGRYSLGFIAEAQRRNGTEAVDVADPQTLRSARDTLRKNFALVADALGFRQRAARADVIHAMNEQVAPLGLVLSILTGTPLVISVHGTYADARAYPWYLRPMYWCAFRYAASVVAVSRFTAGVMSKSFGRKDVSVVPGGFDVPMFRSARSLRSDTFHLLAVGALKPRKGYHTLIAAVSELHQKGCPMQLRIVGTPHDRAYERELLEQTTQLGLSTIVTFEQGLTDEALNRAYRESDLFVLPSEHSGPAFEGLGLVYLEALARGTPVIGCRQSGAEDIIIDGRNGALVDPGRPDQLARAIRSILSNADEWRRMSTHAPESVARFAWDKVGEMMAGIYKNVCNSKA